MSAIMSAGVADISFHFFSSLCFVSSSFPLLPLFCFRLLRSVLSLLLSSWPPVNNGMNNRVNNGVNTFCEKSFAK